MYYVQDGGGRFSGENADILFYCGIILFGGCWSELGDVRTVPISA